MKFIGQFIQSLVARFRNDVYLEDISTGTIASGGNLGLDANNKIVKADTNAGELSITNASDNRVVTSTGGTGLNAESTLTYGLETLTINSTSSSRPTVSLLNTNADENAPNFNFIKIGASPADNDTLGSIIYASTNDAAEGLNFADIVTTIADASDGDESGKLAIRVVADGSLRNFIEGTGSNSDVVDVNIGYGAGSETVIAGTLTMGSTAFVDNNGVVQVATQGTIDHDSLANFVAAEHYRWDTDISSTATIHTNNITDLHGAGVSGSADQLLTDDGDGTVTSESEAKITTQGGLSRFLKNTTASNFLSNTASNAEFNLYEDVVFYDPTNNTKTNRGMFVSLTKGINAHFTSGTLTQIAGQFGTSNPVSTDTGATVNQVGLVVSAVGNTTGTSSGVGIDIDVVGSDVNDGVIITTPDTTNGQDIKITSSADLADFFGIKTKASGLTQITTTDSDAANAAELAFDIDGDITFDSVTGNIIGKANGSTYTPSADSHLATKKYVDDNIPDEKAANGDKFVWKYVKVVADQSACTGMNSTPVELIPAQGSDTIIVVGPGYLFVDKNTSQTQNNAAADLHFHFADLEPGTFGQTALFHFRRFMNGDNADRIYYVAPFASLEVGQNLTQGTNKAIEASFDAAITPNSITSITFHLSYYVIDLS